jgi:hypothetical protein
VGPLQTATPAPNQHQLEPTQTALAGPNQTAVTKADLAPSSLPGMKDRSNWNALIPAASAVGEPGGSHRPPTQGDSGASEAVDNQNWPGIQLLWPTVTDKQGLVRIGELHGGAFTVTRTQEECVLCSEVGSRTRYSLIPDLP